MQETCKVLGYTEWSKLARGIAKAQVSCKQHGNKIEDHFFSIANMVDLGFGAKREIKDYKLTRYACYLTSQNGDSRKEEIVFV